MGVVYLGIGWDGSQVAVKVLRPELADDQEFRRRFRREVSALMRVKGVCTVRVIEADTESAQPFMITEYAEGPSLAEYIDSYGLIGPDMLYGLATGLAEALTVIHAAGIVHRDFKPSNVILTDAGPKVIDFGIAQALDATSMTQTGHDGRLGWFHGAGADQRAARPASRHLRLGRDGRVRGHRAAAVRHRGHPRGLYRVMHGDPDISGVPDPLRSLVAAALTKDPDQRPTARQLLDQLTGISMGRWRRPRASRSRPPRPSSRRPGSRPDRVLSGPRPARRGSQVEWLAAPRARPASGPVPPPGSTTPSTHPGAADGSPGRFSRRTAAIGTAALAAAAVAAAGGLRHPARARAEGRPGRQRGRPGNGDPGRAEHPADLSRTAGARRLPADRPHRHLGEHDGDDGLTEDRRRRPPAVLRVDRRRADLAAGSGSAA
jgi:serine/threonine protein kinase